MNLQRRNFFAILSGSVLSLFGQGALAANGPLVKPKRLGQVIIFRNKKYTAIKKGKLLVWDKGVAIKATASASPTASASQSATPKPSESATASALTFVAKLSDIADSQTKVILVKPASSASFSVAVTKVGSVITVISAICTHRGCIVEPAGNQLGCQCHGSAFNPFTGVVIKGPAELALKKYEVSEDAGSIYIVA
jgi:Rieske Fe-S protein